MTAGMWTRRRPGPACPSSQALAPASLDIDYLRAHSKVEDIWYCLDDRRLEHIWAERIGLAEGASVPQVDFGSTDCGCEGHLFLFEQRLSRERFRQLLGKGIRTAAC